MRSSLTRCSRPVPKRSGRHIISWPSHAAQLCDEPCAESAHLSLCAGEKLMPFTMPLMKLNTTAIDQFSLERPREVDTCHIRRLLPSSLFAYGLERTHRSHQLPSPVGVE